MPLPSFWVIKMSLFEIGRDVNEGLNIYYATFYNNGVPKIVYSFGPNAVNLCFKTLPKKEVVDSIVSS